MPNEEIVQEGILEVQETPVVQDTVQENTQENPEAWKSRYDALEAQYREASQKSAQFDELVSKWEQERVEEVAAQFTEAGIPDGEGGFTPLSEQQKSEVARLISDGYNYRRTAPKIAEQNMLSEALLSAWEVVGDNATTKELRQVMTEMVELDDPRLMKRHVEYLKRTRRGVVQEQRSVIDRVPTSPIAPIQPSSAEEIAEIIRQPGGVNRLTTEQKRLYNEHRKSQGLPTVSGW